MLFVCEKNLPTPLPCQVLSDEVDDGETDEGRGDHEEGIVGEVLNSLDSLAEGIEPQLGAGDRLNACQLGFPESLGQPPKRLTQPTNAIVNASVMGGDAECNVRLMRDTWGGNADENPAMAGGFRANVRMIAGGGRGYGRGASII